MEIEEGDDPREDAEEQTALAWGPGARATALGIPVPPPVGTRAARGRSVAWAWGASAAIHVALFAIAFPFLRSALTAPTVDFGRGDGGESGALRLEPAPAPPPALPLAAPLTPASPELPDFAPAAAPEVRADPPLPALPGAGDAGADSPVIGVGAAGTGKPPAFARPKVPGTEGAAQARGSEPSRPDGAGGRAGVPAGAAGVSLAAPVYPEAARRRREQGRVKLAVEILPDGSIGKIEVVADPGHPLLVGAAVDAVKRTRFSPMLEGGKPVRSVVEVPFDFVLR